MASAGFCLKYSLPPSIKPFTAPLKGVSTYKRKNIEKKNCYNVESSVFASGNFPPWADFRGRAEGAAVPLFPGIYSKKHCNQPSLEGYSAIRVAFEFSLLNPSRSG